jgi:hypothetical protein
MSAQIIPFNASQIIKKCSFCGTEEKVAKSMFSSGDHMARPHRICDRCVIKSKARMDEYTEPVKLNE